MEGSLPPDEEREHTLLSRPNVQKWVMIVFLSCRGGNYLDEDGCKNIFRRN